MDSDGFITLIHKAKPEPAAVVEQPKKEKKPRKNPFKKGSWKAWLYKKLKKWKSSKSVEAFHFIKLENIVVYRKSKPKAIISKRRFKEEDLDKLTQKYKDDCYVLINTEDNTFCRISLKSYLKLIKISRMIVNFRLDVYEDDDKYEEPCTIYDKEIVIDSINSLLGFVSYLRHLITSVTEVELWGCAYSEYRYKFKTVVIYEDGSVKTFKGDFNEVLEEYGITPLL